MQKWNSFSHLDNANKRFTTLVLKSSDRLLLCRWGGHSKCTLHSVSRETKRMKWGLSYQLLELHDALYRLLFYGVICKAPSNIVLKRALSKMFSSSLWVTECQAAAFNLKYSSVYCIIWGCYSVKAGTHSVYGVLVSTVKPQPAGQLWVFMSLWRWTPLSLWTIWWCGDICQTVNTLL